MKKLFTILAATLAFAGAANAQQVASNGNTNSNTTATTTSGDNSGSCYCCPKGDYCSSAAGTCALHVNLNLVKDGEYYCPMEDNVSSGNAGSCPVSGKEMKQMKGKCSGSSDNSNDSKSQDNNKKMNKSQENKGGDQKESGSNK